MTLLASILWVLESIALILLSMMASCPTPSSRMKEQVAAALEAGATDDELESIYDCALLLIDNFPDEEESSLPALSGYIGASRGHDLPSICILRLTDHATMIRDTGGPGVSIILLHAQSIDVSMVREIYPPLSKEARVIMYDIRGFGYAQDAPLVQSIAQLADDLGSLLEALSIEWPTFSARPTAAHWRSSLQRSIRSAYGRSRCWRR